MAANMKRKKYHVEIRKSALNHSVNNNNLSQMCKKIIKVLETVIYVIGKDMEKLNVHV